MEFLLLSLIAAIGGFMRGFAGSATTLFMVPLFSLLLPPAEAVLVGVLLDVVATAPLFPRAARQADWRVIAPLLAGGISTIPLGTWLLVSLPVDTMRAVIALTVMLSVVLLASGWRYRGRRTAPLSFAVGAGAGTIGSATGIGGPPITLYFIATGALAAEVRASLNVYSLLRMSLSAAAIGWAGGFGVHVLGEVALLLPAMLAATWVGTRAFGRTSERLFRRVLLTLLFLLGAVLLARALAG